MDLKEQIINILEDMDISSLISFVAEYAFAVSNDDLLYLDADTFSEDYDGMSALDILDSLKIPFEGVDDYYHYTAYGVEFVDEDTVYKNINDKFGEIADTIIDNPAKFKSFMPDEMQKLFAE